MFLVPLLTILFIIWIIFYVVNSSHNNAPKTYNNNQGFSVDRSLEILRERYAKGEIDEEEYKRIMRNLER